MSRTAENSLTSEITWHHVFDAGFNFRPDHLIQDGTSRTVPPALELHQIFKIYPAMRAHHVVRNLSSVEEVDQELT